MNELENYKTNLADFFLFANSNFLTGAGTVLNLAGNFYSFNESESPEEADYKALKNDFSIIGMDIKNVILGNI